MVSVGDLPPDEQTAVDLAEALGDSGKLHPLIERLRGGRSDQNAHVTHY